MKHAGSWISVVKDHADATLIQTVRRGFTGSELADTAEQIAREMTSGSEFAVEALSAGSLVSALLAAQLVDAGISIRGYRTQNEVSGVGASTDTDWRLSEVEGIGPSGMTLFSSGSTGSPTPTRIQWASLGGLSTDRARKSTVADRPWVSTHPLDSPGGFAVLLGTLAAGRTLAVCAGSELSSLIVLLRRLNAEAIVTSPEVLPVLMKLQSVSNSAPDLMMIGVGGSPLSPDLGRDVARSFGCPVVDSYGAAEFGGPTIVCATYLADGSILPASPLAGHHLPESAEGFTRLDGGHRHSGKPVADWIRMRPDGSAEVVPRAANAADAERVSQLGQIAAELWRSQRIHAVPLPDKNALLVVADDDGERDTAAVAENMCARWPCPSVDIVSTPVAVLLPSGKIDLQHYLRNSADADPARSDAPSGSTD